MTLAPYTTATLGQGAAYLNGRIYRIAGEVDPTQGTSTTTVEVYTVATNTWAAAPAYPQAVFGLAVLALGGDIYTAGGAQYLGLTAKTYRYDPGAGVWDDGPIADLPGPAGSTAAGFYNGRWLLAAGGYGSTANVVAWDPAANTWSSLDEAPQAVTQAGGAVAGSAFYMVGGRVGSAPTNVTQAYTETACATPSPTPAPRRRPPRRPASARRPARCSSATCPPAALSMPMCAAWPAADRRRVCGWLLHVGASVTRGQLAKFVANAAGYADSIPPGQQTFVDVPPANPFWLFVERAAAHR